MRLDPVFKHYMFSVGDLQTQEEPGAAIRIRDSKKLDRCRNKIRAGRKREIKNQRASLNKEQEVTLIDVYLHPCK